MENLLGRGSFESETGIKESGWAGVYWANWSDALAEAGYAPNEKQGRLDTNRVLEALCGVIARLGKFPTSNEWALLRRSDPTLPNYKTLHSHLGEKESMMRRVGEWAATRPECLMIVDLLDLPLSIAPPEKAKARREGHVYLLRSGQRYKIGRSDEIERRVKEIRVSLPDVVELVHSIVTDDPSGIEAYWRRRFSHVRENGEWFRLTAKDVAAFKRRKFQ